MSASRPNPLTAPFRSLGRHRTLIWALAMRDILSPHAGQMLGPLWAVLSPLLFIALLTVIFNVLLGARFGISSDLPLDYSAFILAGLVPWQTVAIVLGRGCVEIIGKDILNELQGCPG